MLLFGDLHGTEFCNFDDKSIQLIRQYLDPSIYEIKISEINTEYIHFGCLSHKWGYHPNSFIIEVQPKKEREKKDVVCLEKDGALLMEDLRNIVFEELKKILEKHKEF